MSKEVYEKTLATAVAELKALQTKQAEIDKQIVSTKQMIVSLRALLGKKTDVGAAIGLKDGCLQVLRAAETPLTLAQVATELEKIGFSLGRYSNPMSAVKNTLARMIGKEIKVETTKGKKRYTATAKDDWLSF
jgi:hypothetical protein